MQTVVYCSGVGLIVCLRIEADKLVMISSLIRSVICNLSPEDKALVVDMKIVLEFESLNAKDD